MSTTAIYLNLLRWEWFRLRQRAGFWAITAVVALLIVGTLVGVAMISSQSLAPFAIPAQGFPVAAFQALSRLGPFLGVVLASFLLGNEFAWGTWRTLIARGDPRDWAIHSKLLLGSGILLAIWVLGWCVASAAGLIFGDDNPGVIAELFFEVPDGWGRAAAMYFASLPVAITYLALGALLCMAWRSSTAGVGVGVGIVVAESVAYPVANLVVSGLYDFELAEYTRWTLWGVSNGLMGRDELSAVWFLPAIVAYLAVFYGLALLIFKRRDVDSGNG